MTPLVVLVLVALAILVYYFYPRKRGGAQETELLQLCHGDRDQMERLIALERRKNPAHSRGEAIAQAVYSLRRDKR